MIDPHTDKLLNCPRCNKRWISKKELNIKSTNLINIISSCEDKQCLYFNEKSKIFIIYFPTRQLDDSYLYWQPDKSCLYTNIFKKITLPYLPFDITKTQLKLFLAFT